MSTCEGGIRKVVWKNTQFAPTSSSSNQFTFSFLDDLSFGSFLQRLFAGLMRRIYVNSTRAKRIVGWLGRARSDYLSNENTTCSKPSSIKIYISSNNEAADASESRVTNDSQIGQTNHRRIMTKWFPWELICIRFPAPAECPRHRAKTLLGQLGNVDESETKWCKRLLV